MSVTAGLLILGLLFNWTSSRATENIPANFAPGGPDAKITENPLTSIPVTEFISCDVIASYDADGILDQYHSRIFTPVCEGGNCYDIQIDLYWDLIGRFHHFDTIPGQGLTKLDHIPFTARDYVKLHNILGNKESLLAGYSKEELVKDKRSSGIDGITGATVQQIKESVIDGAVYSCYTLWHIANGPATDSIQSVTDRSLNRELVKKLVDQEDQELNYFLINRLSNKEFWDYLPEVMEMIRDGEGYFIKNAIEKMPGELLANNRVQDFFAVHFSEMNYFAQVVLLEKLEPNSLHETLETALRQSLDKRSSYRNELIRSLLGD